MSASSKIVQILGAEPRQLAIVLFGSLLLFCVTQLLYEQGVVNLYLQRQAVERHHYWHLFSGHLVHLNWQHLILNWLGWGLTVLLFPAVFNWQVSVVVSLLASLSISIALLIWLENLNWYCGYSGVIHSMLMVGIVLTWRQPIAKLVLVILSAKIIYEMVGGTVSAGIITSVTNVVHEAHWFGFAFGIPIGFLIKYWGLSRQPS